MKEMLIIGVDVGSVAQGNFAWCDSDGKASTSILELRDDLNDALASGRPVAVSFECPLSVPCPDDEALLSRSRPGEGNRSFLAGAGASATLTGLQELLWLLGEVRKTHPATRATTRVVEFRSGFQVLVTEAFITGSDKSNDSHIGDARKAMESLARSLQSKEPTSCLQCIRPFSLAGAAVLWSGLSDDIGLLSAECLVVRPTKDTSAAKAGS